MLDEIETGTTIFIDANIFLYEILDHWRYAESCNSLLEHINMGKYHAVVSVLVCNEVFHRVMIAEVVERYEIEPKSAVNYLKKNWGVVRELNKARDSMLNIDAIENLEIVEINREVYGIALECSKKYGLLSNDAVHPVTMKKHGITNIATNDRDFERAPWLNIYKP
ncbi:MAG: PIN domain-containing protein [Euryarchaeota archaeon]|nr:PIN domain-containing protein [Euryarchaeota archaeon]